MKEKKLIVMNGRWAGNRGGHMYICAYSKADAVRLYNEARGSEGRGVLSEINNYFRIGQWGFPMDGITPKRGVWVSKGLNDKPVRMV